MPCASFKLDPNKGPTLNLGISTPGTVKPALQAGTQHVLYRRTALVDTGASITCISREVADRAGLRPLGKKPVIGAGGVEEMNVYLVDVVLPIGDPGHPGTSQLVKEEMEVMEFAGTADIQALLGRDIIKQCLFIMSGWDSSFTLCA